MAVGVDADTREQEEASACDPQPAGHGDRQQAIASARRVRTTVSVANDPNPPRHPANHTESDKGRRPDQTPIPNRRRSRTRDRPTSQHADDRDHEQRGACKGTAGQPRSPSPDDRLEAKTCQQPERKTENRAEPLPLHLPGDAVQEVLYRVERAHLVGDGKHHDAQRCQREHRWVAPPPDERHDREHDHDHPDVRDALVVVPPL